MQLWSQGYPLHTVTTHMQLDHTNLETARFLKIDKKKKQAINGIISSFIYLFSLRVPVVKKNRIKAGMGDEGFKLWFNACLSVTI